MESNTYISDLEDYTSDVRTLKGNAILWMQRFNLLRAQRKTRQKLIEEAFKKVKSFLKFQPTFVYTDENVRTHYTICILSYLLDMTFTNKLRERPIDEVGSARKVHKTLSRCELGKVSVNGTNRSGLKLMPLTADQKSIMELFNNRARNKLCSFVLGVRSSTYDPQVALQSVQEAFDLRLLLAGFISPAFFPPGRPMNRALHPTVPARL